MKFWDYSFSFPYNVYIFLRWQLLNLIMKWFIILLFKYKDFFRNKCLLQELIITLRVKLSALLSCKKIIPLRNCVSLQCITKNTEILVIFSLVLFKYIYSNLIICTGLTSKHNTAWVIFLLLILVNNKWNTFLNHKLWLI